MCCNNQIHDELKNMEESSCPFCDQPLVINKVIEPCCSEQDVEIVDGINVCINCGLVHGYDFTTEYVNFHDNMYSRTSPYGHLSNTDTSLIRAVHVVPGKCPYILYKNNLYNTDPL